MANEIKLIEKIELTPEQKQEMIDICNKIWPGLSFHFWTSTEEEEYNSYFGYNNTHIIGRDEYYPAVYMHWFEFLVRMILSNDLDELEDFYHKISK